MEYMLLIHRAEEGGYWAEVPALDGCFVQGETLEDLLADAPEAIAAHVDALCEVCEGRKMDKRYRMRTRSSSRQYGHLFERRRIFLEVNVNC